MTNLHRIQRPTTAQMAQQRLAVRYNYILDSWEVFTYLTGAFDTSWKWFQITKETADWYLNAKRAHKVDDILKQENAYDNTI